MPRAAAEAAAEEKPALSAAELYNKQKREGQYNLLVPLLYAPLAPLIRIGFRHNPPVRNALFGATVLAALTHAGVMMSRDSTM